MDKKTKERVLELITTDPELYLKLDKASINSHLKIDDYKPICSADCLVIIRQLSNVIDQVIDGPVHS